ncbi:LOW QUALITY PROTEIN: odorant receptor 63a [Anastrepha obliqua]|uniref:LOW QUALITY PROTEIN: odorant receptor 63a n=1 Tax=Anastrepha obliqua TaxID=95512 RepID=UPI00240A4C4F|nr:LOW QUALITY PROTEIN: odorant receptor 63a [Anastrepha obliqua]
MTIETIEEVRKRNYNSIKVLFGVSFALGVNLTAPSKFKDSLKIINVILVVSSTLSLYAHWCYLVRHFDSIPLIAETVCTALQTLISTFKLVYYLFTQRTFYRLVDQALTHEVIRKIEIFQYDFPINNQLQQEIDDIMKGVWRNTRRQLLFYFSTCVAILCNYFFGALFVNLYHQLKQTPNYVHILPFPALYPFWEDKGMAFPYYHIQMYMSGTAIYIAATCAVSFDGVFLVLCQHAVGLLKVFNLLVLRATSPLIPADRRIEYLRYTIFTYQRIAKYVDQIQAIFRHISLSQFVLSLIVFGFVLFEMSFGLESSVTIFIRMIMYLMAAGTQIVLYCYNGQQLTIASEQIPISFYSCNWYEETEKFKQLVRMMIMRTNRHFFLEVSWFTFMNLATLIALFRMSGSYFLLLRNLQEN